MWLRVRNHMGEAQPVLPLHLSHLLTLMPLSTPLTLTPQWSTSTLICLHTSAGKRIAVIENEFGEIDIDSELVAKQVLGGLGFRRWGLGFRRWGSRVYDWELSADLPPSYSSASGMVTHPPPLAALLAGASRGQQRGGRHDHNALQRMPLLHRPR